MDKLDKQIKSENAIIKVTPENIQGKIYTIRGQRVMLDSDLAAIYGYSTRTFNQQVKNNIEKFEEDFMFQLTKDETENLMSIFLISNSIDISTVNANSENLMSKILTSSWGGRRKLPYVFTEQGIYMLMTVLKGELAVQQSKALIRLFKGMKDYIAENQGLIGIQTLAQLTVQNSVKIMEIESKLEQKADKKDIAALQSGLDKVMENFIDPDSYKHFLILDGQKIEAEAAYDKIYASAKQSVYVIDNYIGLKTLEMLRSVKKNVKITIFSDNIGAQKLTKSTYNAFCKEYPNISITLKQTNGKFHDRYIVLDAGTPKETIYHCGASAKDAGSRITTITKLDDTRIYQTIISALAANGALTLK